MILITFVYKDFKITADGDCSHEIKRHLLLGRKVMINLDSILKTRDITLPTKVRLVRAMVFPVVMYDVKVVLWRKLSAEELMLLNCSVGEDSWESLRLQGNPTSPSYRRSTLGVHGNDWCWRWNSKLWSPDVKNWLIGEASEAGKTEGRSGKGQHRVR